MQGKSAWLLLSVADFLKNETFLKIKISEIPPENQIFWIQIRHNILLILIWVQTVCEGYQQIINVVATSEKKS